MINWISNKTSKPFYARKRFFIESLDAVKEATLSCVGVGQFEVLINGKVVDGSVLNGS